MKSGGYLLSLFDRYLSEFKVCNSCAISWVNMSSCKMLGLYLKYYTVIANANFFLLIFLLNSEVDLVAIFRWFDGRLEDFNECVG
jgi:hypothetical protein